MRRLHQLRTPRSRVRRRLLPVLLVGTGLVAAACQLDELLRAPDPNTGPGTTGATAVRLAFIVQPAATARGTNISPALRIAALDQDGNPVTTFGGTIGVSLAENPGDATLQGTTIRTALNGVAEFSDLALNRPGRGYRLSAAGGDLVSATSNAFDVLDRSPAALVEVSGNGQTDTAGATLRIPYVIRVLDGSGQPLPGIQVGWSTGATGGAVNPATAVTGSAGAAETIHTLGTVAGEYTVTAWVGAIPDETVTFTARARAGQAVQLVFTQEPSSTNRQEPIQPPVVVTALDRFGNTATGFTAVVTMTLVPGTGTPGARLEGDRTRAAVDGVARFNDLSVRDAGLSYRLRATAPGNLQRDSAPFHVWLVLNEGDDAGFAVQLDPLGFRPGAAR